MVAAAYAKDLLYRITPHQVEQEARIVNVLKKYTNINFEGHNSGLDPTKDQLTRARGRDSVSVPGGRTHESHMPWEYDPRASLGILRLSKPTT